MENVCSCRKKEANISESYETIRHLLSRDEVCFEMKIFE